MTEQGIPYFLTDDLNYFPDANLALKEPNGLLAIGGDLKPERLLAAYRQGIFPWYDKEPILWWSPDPRTILLLNNLHISTSMKKVLHRHDFTITMDEQFTQVIQNCATVRAADPGTWITPQMQAAYIELHELGYAHSLEICVNGSLVGGIYGVSLGKLFFGESMFSLQPNASKIAIIYLVKQLKAWDFEFIDCQMWSEHLGTLGATTVPRQAFLQKLAQNNTIASKVGKWTFEGSLLSR
ncbi:MAG: leucyl/phenylalanyl-tRNA--protein transferase [Proteobacteria bacterium]|nr:leucyl/phenylalanyl-tRNA--protein transferase [Pseudomonadota bacterium]